MNFSYKNGDETVSPVAVPLPLATSLLCPVLVYRLLLGSALLFFL